MTVNKYEFGTFTGSRGESGSGTAARSKRALAGDQDRGSCIDEEEDEEMHRIKCNPHTRLKRYIVYLIAVAVSAIITWQVYEYSKDEPNYLGTLETGSVLGRFSEYALSTDARPCARVGSSLLAKGGSATDAAIGTLLCMSVVLPNSLGLGGGCLMTMYDRKTGKAVVIDGRETAPSYASENMFANNSNAAKRGPLSVGVPGELAAYWRAHQMFGKLKWSELFEDSIRMAKEGIPTVDHLADALKNVDHAQHISNSLGKLFLAKDGHRYVTEGELLVQERLADTLTRIRDLGAQEFYAGLTGQRFIDDLQAQGGKMSMADLANYTVEVREPLVFNLAPDLVLHTPPPPGSGVVLSIILRIMTHLGYFRPDEANDPRRSADAAGLYYHRLVESFKFAYAQRAGLEDKADDPGRMERLMAKLLSEEYIRDSVSKIDGIAHHDDRYGAAMYFKEDHGTAHVSVLDSEGNAVAASSSINLYFGSGLWSAQTGILYNDVMDDFVTANVVNQFGLVPSKYNKIRPGKRPLSSMAPSVFTDKNGNARLILGSSGGSMITTSIALVSIRNQFLGDDIKTAIDAPRLYHQFLPDKITYERTFDKKILQSLVERGHKIQPILGRSSVTMAVAADYAPNGLKYITANSDYRKGGTVEGL